MTLRELKTLRNLLNKLGTEHVQWSSVDTVKVLVKSLIRFIEEKNKTK